MNPVNYRIHSLKITYYKLIQKCLTFFGSVQNLIIFYSSNLLKTSFLQSPQLLHNISILFSIFFSKPKIFSL